MIAILPPKSRKSLTKKLGNEVVVVVAATVVTKFFQGGLNVLGELNYFFVVYVVWQFTVHKPNSQTYEFYVYSILLLRK